MRLRLIHSLALNMTPSSLSSYLSEGVSDQVPPNIEELYGLDGVKTFQNALSFMPKDKVFHSLRVGGTAHKLGLSKESVSAAILHDYIERGGDLSLLSKLSHLGVSDHAIRVIKLLSVEEKTPGADDNQVVYDHIKKMLGDPDIDNDTKDICIIIKCSDRLDNLRKRVRRGELTPEYYDASLKLLNMLMKRYRGDNKWSSYINTKLGQIEEIVEAFGYSQKVKSYV